MWQLVAELERCGKPADHDDSGHEPYELDQFDADGDHDDTNHSGNDAHITGLTERLQAVHGR